MKQSIAASVIAACFCAAGMTALAVDFNMLSCCPGENTATQARFVWHSDSSSCLLFCAKASSPENVYTILPYARQNKPVAFRSADGAYYKYEAQISDLEPDTEYLYWVEAGSDASTRQKFKTAGTSGSFNFLWMSDVHAHPDNPGKMTTVELLRQDAEAQTASSGGIDLVLFSGDAVKYGSRYDNWQQWNGAPTVTNYMFAMIPGNKEYYYTGSSTFYDYYWYLAVKNNPPNGPDATEQEGCYWFLRDGVMFVGIDSLIHKGSRMTMYNKKSEVLVAQTNWFDKVVTSQRGKFRYLVVFQHDPWFVYAASNNSFDKSRGNYDTWRHVFDKHKVDLALSGDEHNYIRTKPLRGDAANSEGTIYMVAGQIEESNYSATITTDIASYGNSNATKYFDCMGATDASCGAAWIEVRPDSLKVTEFWDKWQSPNYKVYDTVTITPKARGWAFEDIGARAHKRYRFAVDAPRSDSRMMQLSEIELLDANGNVIPPSDFTLAWDLTTTNSAGQTYPSNENPGLAADGKLDTKWLDYRAGLDNPADVRAAAWLDFCFSSPVKISGYRWYTAGDNSWYPSRAPVSWTLSAYDDNDDTCYILDRVSGYDSPKDNKVLAYPLPPSPDEPDEPAGPGESAVTTAGGVYYALSVGVNNYENDRQNKLNGCVADAEDVLSACTNGVKGLWNPMNCRCLSDSAATRSAVRAQFQALAGEARKGDTVLYYHSSHGGDDCLCLYDAEYYADQLAEDLMRFAAGVRVVVVLDTCHSASMFKGADEDSKSGPWYFAASVQAYMDEMQTVLTKGAKSAAASGPSVGWVTACDDDQTSLESNKRGKFTKPFVEAWKTDGTDANGDGYNDFKEMFNIAAPKAVDSERAPQTLNESLLRNVAAWEVFYHPVVSDKWLEETMDTRLSTGAWSEPVSYDSDGRAYLGGEVVFTPFHASTGNVVTVETKAQFCEYTSDDVPDMTAQAAVRLGTNGCFQVWTGGKSGVESGGVGELGWVDVEAEGVTPVSGAEYTLRTTFDYTTNTYSVEVKCGDEWLPLKTTPNSHTPNSSTPNSHTPNSSTPNSQLSTSSFPIAAVTNCISSVAFVGDTLFTSLDGDCRYEIIGFVADEALVLSNNVQIVLGAAKAAWLNNCAGGKATVAGAAAGLSDKEFSDAYLLNLDITDGGRSYAFEITSVDVGDTSVSVAVTLTRSGSIAQPINGVLKFYGAATLAAFKDGATELGAAELTNETFAGGETATATIPLSGETPPAFFNAKIEEQ